MTWITCDCGKKFEMYSGQSKSCPSCGKVASLGSSSNWVTCSKCTHKFEVHSGQAKPCPSCGTVARR
jgi:DNA-directed RNA polymerase subunit RPC12/RpoP